MSASTNAAQVIKGLKKTIQNDIPFATSRAMELTIREGVDAAETEFERYVRTQGANYDADDRPTPQLAKKGPGKGAIRGNWPSKKELQTGQGRNGRSVDAKVFIVNRQSGRGTFDLIDEFHPMVFGGREADVPKGSRYVLTPTKQLLEGLRGRGKLKRLNKYGNLSRLRQGLLKELNNNSDYLNVPVGTTDKNLQHLKPGLYFRATARATKGTRQRPVAGVLKRAQTGKRNTRRPVNNFLVMLLSYDLQRVTRGEFDFPQTVMKVYEKRFAKHLSEQIVKAVTK